LRLTASVEDGDSGTYDFSGHLDAGAAYLAWVQIKATVARQNDSAGLFDDLPKTFDELAGLFDDLGGGQFADANVLFYVSVTQDDPDGAPTWGAYQPFRAGNFFGRGFRFRVELRTTTDDITPLLTALSATVER